MRPSWALFELSWAVLEACWALLAAWMALLGRLGAFGELQGSSMAAQGPPGVGVMHARLRDERGVPLRRLQKPCQTALGILARLNVLGGTVADIVRSIAKSTDRGCSGR